MVLIATRFYLDMCALDYDMLYAEDESDSQVDAIVDLPPISRITAPLLDDLTFSRKHARSREKDLAADCDVSKAARAAVQRLSNTPISTATTLDEVNAAQDVRRQVREDSRSFFSSNKRRRQAKTQRLRTKRTYATLAAAQRRGIKTEVQKEIRRMLKAKTEKTVMTDEELREMGEEATTTDSKMDSKDNGNLRMHLTCSAAFLWLWSTIQHFLVFDFISFT